MDVPVCDADVVVLAGDIHSDGRIAIDWASNFPQEVIYILGNHEFYSGGTISDLPKDLKNYAEKYSNVHVLNDDSIVIKGIAFHGCTLWTDFELYGKPDVAFFYAEKSLNDYRLINFDRRQAFTPAIAAALHMESMDWLSETICSSKFVNNVVVTHHLPTPDACGRCRVKSQRASRLNGDSGLMFLLSAFLGTFMRKSLVSKIKVGDR